MPPNQAEAEVVAHILKGVLAGGGGGGCGGGGWLGPEEIGVVTPYAAQVFIRTRVECVPTGRITANLWPE